MADREKTNERRTGEDGFSLIELIVALAVLAIVLGAALPAMYSALGLARNNRNRSIAANLGSQEIDIVRETAAANFNNLSATEVVTLQVVDGTTYTIKRDGEWVVPGATSSSCSSTQVSPNAPQYLRMTVAVTWPDMRGAAAVQNQTIVAPPTGSFNPYLAAIGIQVKDVKNQPEAGIPVTVASATTTPPFSQTLPTEVDGCIYFAGLTASTYTITLSKSGWVDGQLNPSATLTQTLKPGDSIQLQPIYDQSGTLSATYLSNSTPGGLVPPNIPITVYNSALTPVGTQTLTSTTINGLYPYPNGYKLWTGDCGDADPEGLKPPPPTPLVAYYPGQSRAAPIIISSGVTTAATLAVRSVDVKVTHTPGAIPWALTPVTIIANHAADNVCASGDSLSVTGTTDATGTLRIALPYGTWSFDARVTIAAPAHVWIGNTSVPATISLSPTGGGVPSASVSTT